MGHLMGTPATTDSVVICRAPATTGATSVLVPPISKVRKSWYPLASATKAAPTTPPAGPERRQEEARRAASSSSVTPPDDCMTRGLGIPASAIRSARAAR